MKPSVIVGIVKGLAIFPSSVTAGETTATFEITTSESLPPGAVQKATIIATAVVMRVATLTIVPEPTNWRKISYT